MKLFDTHFHYRGEAPPEKYSREASEAGTKYLMATGGNLEESLLCREFAGKIENAWFTCGAHPHEAEKYMDRMPEFEQFRHNPKLRAVGEIGLDYYYDNSERKTQIAVFKKFLSTALTWDLPAVIHCRDKDGKDEAYEDVFPILKNFQSGGGCFVVHCFTGTPEWAEKFLELGAYIGITGIITFPRARNVRDIVKILPSDKMLIETDTPYLAPVPFRGKPNHSAYLAKTAGKVAEILGENVADTALRTTLNAFRFFGIKKKLE